MQAYTAQALHNDTSDAALLDAETSAKRRIRNRSTSYVSGQRRGVGRGSTQEEGEEDDHQFDMRGSNVETGSHTARLH